MKNTFIFKLIIVIFLFFNVGKIISQEKIAKSLTEYNTLIKNAIPGDVIILKNGVWKDVVLNAYGNGTKEAPIIIKAETPGNVHITGNSTLNIYGQHVIVSGLWFKNGATSYKSVVQFRKNSKIFANNCRFTNNTISYFENSTNTKDNWISVWGKNNKIDHNNFTGKRSEGPTLVVWLKDDKHTENEHKIEYNIFGERPDLGKNGGETIRIGTSTNSMKSSKTIVQKNVFYHCDGEIEIISNKSGDNIFRDNLFLESKGTLTLRHGNNALVERNVFLGNNIGNTGGIRIINKGHIVRNNYLIGLTGSGFRGPITVMNGVPNSPLNRYNQVEDVAIVNNTIINCGPIVFGAGKNTERSLAPKNVLFANNLVYQSTTNNAIVVEDKTDGFTFNSNYIDTPNKTAAVGFSPVSVKWNTLQSFLLPSIDNQILLKATKTDQIPNKDINNHLRKNLAVGAFNLGSKKLPKSLTIRAGTGWKPEITKPKIKTKSIVVRPGIETLRKAISKAKSGDILTLQTGEYILEKSIKISGDITIQGDKGGASILRIKEQIEKPLYYFIRLNEESKLTINDVFFDGASKNPKYAIVSPEENKKGSYNISAKNVIFKNFNNNDGGAIFKAYKGTKADTLRFVNCRFEDSYRGLNLSYDKATIGAYNANFILIENSVFKNIKQEAIHYIRNTSSPLSTGGKLIVNHSVFQNIFNQEKGRIIKVNGIYDVVIKNSVFIDSYNLNTAFTLKGSKNNVSNCLFYASGFAKTVLNAKSNNIISKKPKWEDELLYIPSKKSPLLKKNNKRTTIGLIQ